VTLESGLKLDINSLTRSGVVRPGAASGPFRLRWTNRYTDEEIAIGVTIADMTSDEGWLRIRIGSLDQRIVLTSLPRHFGGRQWFFRCPNLYNRCMVLWMPPGARSFACRQRWGRQVAYSSQFLDHNNLAHRAQAKIRSRLCDMGGFNPDEWELPPKPKWMRWRTYNRSVEKFDRYEAVLNAGLAELVYKLQRL
jgi:hypothetical protein